jgi:outer membrane lipoprotein-sorting protein
MDAQALLEKVGESYAKLESFEVEILFTMESGDEDSFSHSRQRARALFAAPNKIRFDCGGRQGTVVVSDGVDIHHYYGGQKYYQTSAVEPGHRLQGQFNPKYPLPGGNIFLFNHIAEGVGKSEILREEPEAQVVVSVTYDTVPDSPFSASTITFWVDMRTNLVSRVEGEVTHVMPPDNERHTSRQLLSYGHAFLNQEIPPQAFEYVPPADAIVDSDRRRRGGSGTARYGAGGYETWHSAAWEDGTFVDNFDLNIRGLELIFERRLTFDDKDLKISEKIAGPQGETEHQWSIPVAE